MAYGSQKRPLNAEDTIKLFVAFKIIDTMNSRDDLFFESKYPPAGVSDKIIKSFKSFMTNFNGLFKSTRYNIERSSRIPDWDEKDEKYEEFFSNNCSITPANISLGLSLFDEFCEDLVRAGIWKLLEEMGMGEEGFEANEESNEEEGVVIESG